MSNKDSRVKSKVMERIALGLVVIFALGMSYALHATQQTVDSINQQYDSPTEVYDQEKLSETQG
jgi:cell division protein FtsN